MKLSKLIVIIDGKKVIVTSNGPKPKVAHIRLAIPTTARP